MTREKGDNRYNIVSSIRYKDNVQIAPRAEGLLSLEPKTWDWGGELAEDDFRRGTSSYGLVADDVAAVFPDAVMFDDQGRPQYLQAGPLFAGLLGEIKHLSAQVAALTARVEALEAN